MPQTQTQIRHLLASAGMAPNIELGQNFLIDGNLLTRVADAADVQPGDAVLEVGPGTGTLTEVLLERLADGTNGGHLVAVELDAGLHRLLSDRLPEPIAAGRLTLIHADALAELPRVLETLAARGSRSRLVANLPYQIASPLIVNLLLQDSPMQRLVFLVQKEVADRLTARVGTKAYGPLSIDAQLLCAKVETLRTLPPSAFWPPPKVTSALVRMLPLSADDRTAALGNAWPLVPTVARHLFAYRRKTLGRTLRELANRADLPTPDWPARLEHALTAVDVALDRRAESLDPPTVRAIANALPPPHRASTPPSDAV